MCVGVEHGCLHQLYACSQVALGEFVVNPNNACVTSASIHVVCKKPLMPCHAGSLWKQVTFLGDPLAAALCMA